MVQIFLYVNETNPKAIDCDEQAIKKVCKAMDAAGIDFEPVPSRCQILTLSVDGILYKGIAAINGYIESVKK